MTKSEEIIAKYNSGVSVINLAKEYNLTRERIYQYLRQVPDFKSLSKKKRLERVKSRMESFSHLTPQIEQGLREKKSLTLIAKELGISYLTAKNLIKGTPMDTSKKAKAKRNEAINKAYVRGLSQVKIAKKFNLCQSAISAILLKTNNGQLPKRPKKGL